MDEWAHAKPYRSEQERRDAFPKWPHTYNHHRPRRTHRARRQITRRPRPQPPQPHG
ncbi:hypothetical protein [Streptomyces sp. ISL-63]|uniref:hypothetical protein n=1 Tax=unclassified Streptomyces TaxID=2593676 RepID=UPI0035ABB594